MRPILLKEKPLSEVKKKQLNEAARLLFDWQDKKDLAYHFRCDERHVRDMISMIAKRVPIISNSGQRGYKRAVDTEDLPLAIQTRNELISRRNEIDLRIEPLDKFIKEQEAQDG